MGEPSNDNIQNVVGARPRPQTRRVARIVAYTMLFLFLLIFALLAVALP